MDEQQLKVEPEYTKPLVGVLWLYCIKCTRHQRFQGASRQEAINQAVVANWHKRNTNEFICPPCAKKYGLCRPKSASISE